MCVCLLLCVSVCSCVYVCVCLLLCVWIHVTPTVWRQLDANGAKSTTPAGQCRLAPLIPLILASSFLYHFTVKLMFKLYSRE